MATTDDRDQMVLDVWGDMDLTGSHKQFAEALVAAVEHYRVCCGHCGGGYCSRDNREKLHDALVAAGLQAHADEDLDDYGPGFCEPCEALRKPKEGE